MGKTKDLVLEMSKQLNDVHVMMMGMETAHANEKMRVRELEGIAERLAEENQTLHKRVSVLEKLNTFKPTMKSHTDDVLRMEGGELHGINPQDIILRNTEHGYAATFDTKRGFVTKVEKCHTPTAWTMASDDYERQISPEYFKKSLDDATGKGIMQGMIKQMGDTLNDTVHSFNVRLEQQEIHIHNLQQEQGELRGRLDCVDRELVWSPTPDIGMPAPEECSTNVVKKEEGTVLNNYIKQFSGIAKHLAEQGYTTSVGTPDYAQMVVDTKNAVIEISNRLDDLAKDVADKAFDMDVKEQAKQIKSLDSSVHLLENNLSALAAVGKEIASDVREHNKQIKSLDSSIHLLENGACVTEEKMKSTGYTLDILNAKIGNLEEKLGEVSMDVRNINASWLNTYVSSEPKAVVIPALPGGTTVSEIQARLQNVENGLKQVNEKFVDLANQQHKDKEGLWVSVNNQHTSSMEIATKIEKIEKSIDRIYTDGKENNDSISRLSDSISQVAEDANIRLGGIYTRMDGMDKNILDYSSTAWKNHKTVMQLVTDQAEKVKTLEDNGQILLQQGQNTTKVLYDLDDKIRDSHKEMREQVEKLGEGTLNVATAMQKGFEAVGVHFVIPTTSEVKKELEGIQFVTKKD
jgi:hypothetical protein